MLICVPGIACAQFTNFPLHQTYTNADWYTINQCHPIMQLYSATVERIELVNNGTATLSPLNMSAVYVCNAGSNAIAGGWSFATTNITMTNCFTNFVYTYSDYSGTHTATGRPHLTRSMLSALDSAILSLIPYFVSTNAGTIGAPLGSYLTNKFWDVETDVLPIESQGGLFSRNDIGYYTNLTTNAYGWVNGGTAYFTRGKESTFGKVLAETSYTTNGPWTTGWQLSRMDGTGASGFWQEMYPNELGAYVGVRGYWFYWLYFEPEPVWISGQQPNYRQIGPAELYKPVLKYQPGGSNSFTNVQVEIWGEYIDDVWSMYSIPFVETVDMTSTNFQLTNTWVFVSNIVVIGQTANTNDSYILTYTNTPMMLYGERTYNVTTSDMDERWKVLKSLVYTKYGNNDGGGENHPGAAHYYSGREYVGPTQIGPYSNWTECLSLASNALGAATNWSTLTNSTVGKMFNAVAWQKDPDDLYVIRLEAYSGFPLVDSRPIVTNVYAGAGKMHSVYWLDRGLVTGDYYNLSGSNSAPLAEGVFCNSLNVSASDTNNFTDTLYNFYRNPTIALPLPTNTPENMMTRKQIQSDWNVIFDWSPGLKYK